MDIEVNVPDIGKYEVEVTEILVQIDDIVKKDQSLITVEGDKTSIEIPSPISGIVKEIKVNIGDKVETGRLIMIFRSIENEITSSVTQKKEKEKSEVFSYSEKNINIPDIGNEDFEVTEILVQIDDIVKKDQSLITVEGDKTSIEIPSPISGIVKEIKVNIGDKVSTGSLIMIFKEKKIHEKIQDEKKRTNLILEKRKNINQTIENNTNVHATPLIRRLARKFDINLEKVKGSGRKGRILYEDIQNYIKKTIKSFESIVKIENNDNFLNLLPWPRVDFSQFGEIEEIKLSHTRKISGENLRRNWVMIPHVTHFDKVDITDLEEFRKQQNIDFEKRHSDAKITPIIFIMKAVSNALEKMPSFNGSLSEDRQHLILKKYINIGIAVDTSYGLVVPVIKDVNKKNITELSYEVINLTKKARSKKLSKEEMEGGCFTISSIGNLGTTYFSPIINAPEAVILGISKSSIEPVWNGKKFLPRLILPLSLSFDHRIIDGADGARFLTLIKEMLSDIRRLIM